jgi:D-arginine dehydrogenase
MTDADVLVVGAGIAGAGVAAELAGAGRRVVLLEREAQPGQHATGRSAALFSTIYGNPTIRALSRASRAFLEAPPPGFTDTPLLAPRGTLFFATAERAHVLEALREDADVAAGTEVLSPAETRARVPLLREASAAAGLWEPGARDIDVHALHQGYLRRLRAAGGRVALEAGVVGLAREAGSGGGGGGGGGGGWAWVARTAAGEAFRAPVVVNAAGAWADAVAALAGVARRGLSPRRRTVLLVELPRGTDAAGWPLAVDADETLYFKPDAGRLLVSPADETEVEACDAQADALDVAVAVERLEQATTLGVHHVPHRWAGLRTFAPDRVPVVGFAPDAPGFFWLAGQGGYGLQTAPALSRAAAALALGRPLPADVQDAGVREEALSPARLAPLPPG